MTKHIQTPSIFWKARIPLAKDMEPHVHIYIIETLSSRMVEDLLPQLKHQLIDHTYDDVRYG